MANIFEGEDKYPGVTGYLRRSISNAHLDEPHIEKLKQAVRLLRLEPESPSYKQANPKKNTPDVWCHVGIPERKVAIFVADNKKVIRITGIRENWKMHGWSCLLITKENAEGLSLESIKCALETEIGGKK